MKNKLTYLQMPLPSGNKSYKITKIDWAGLNRRQVLDTGVLSEAFNVTTKHAPYLTPSPTPRTLKKYSNPLSMSGFDDFLLVVYTEVVNGYRVAAMDCLTNLNGTVQAVNVKLYSGTQNQSTTLVPRSIVPFTKVPGAVSGTSERFLLIFPDRRSVPYSIKSGTVSSLISNAPNLNYAVVHNSRLFGVDDDRIYASGFNDYANWNLDTATESAADNAWCSAAGSASASKFTGITAYENHVVAFKNDYMHELYNNKNPFRIQDIFAEGTIDNRTICQVGARLIFVDRDNVKMYTGGKPRIIGNNLNLTKIDKATAGGDDRFYYLYCKSDGKNLFFVFDTVTDQWSQRETAGEILSFARNNEGVFCLLADGTVQKLDTETFTSSWYCETDFFTGKTIDIKHIRKIQLFCEMATNSSLTIKLLYDNGTSQIVYAHENNLATKKLPIRVIPRQTADYGFKIRIDGSGFVKLYGLEVFLKQGGELYV